MIEIAIPAFEVPIEFAVLALAMLWILGIVLSFIYFDKVGVRPAFAPFAAACLWPIAIPLAFLVALGLAYLERKAGR